MGHGVHSGCGACGRRMEKGSFDRRLPAASGSAVAAGNAACGRAGVMMPGWDGGLWVARAVADGGGGRAGVAACLRRQVVSVAGRRRRGSGEDQGETCAVAGTGSRRSPAATKGCVRAATRAKRPRLSCLAARGNTRAPCKTSLAPVAIRRRYRTPVRPGKCVRQPPRAAPLWPHIYICARPASALRGCNSNCPAPEKLPSIRRRGECPVLCRGRLTSQGTPSAPRRRSG